METEKIGPVEKKFHEFMRCIVGGLRGPSRDEMALEIRGLEQAIVLGPDKSALDALEPRAKEAILQVLRVRHLTVETLAQKMYPATWLYSSTKDKAKTRANLEPVLEAVKRIMLGEM